MTPPSLHDRAPIVAVSTPPGRSALAVVRLSGAGAFDIAAACCVPWPLHPRQATLCVLRDGEGHRIDHALVTAMPGPASYTGDDTVEFSVHGGLAVTAALLAATIALGARPARPGEFTRRAVLAGKLDLAQAEAIDELIGAGTEAMRIAALHQVDGGLSRRIHAMRDALVALEALLAYDIDFPEEDDGPIAPARVAESAAVVVAALAQLLRTVPAGEALREGAIVVLAGATNVGKSSLFNALLGRARALVTPIPGTTRDTIEAVLDTERWPIRLVDTAGMRDTDDVVEQLGIEASVQALARATVILACGDTPEALTDAVGRVTEHAPQAHVVAVATKSDLAPGGMTTAAVSVSAESGEGLATLVDVVLDVLDQRFGTVSIDTPRLLRERQVHAVRTAHAELVQFVDRWGDGDTPVVISATHVRAAIESLEELIGVVSIDDVLDRVFSTFCIGK
jgi:tRNA modification GTPase